MLPRYRMDAMLDPITPPTERQCVENLLRRSDPGRFLYGRNIWQWFTHHRNHGTLPAELEGCTGQPVAIRWMRPYRSRCIISASCNTVFTATWSTAPLQRRLALLAGFPNIMIRQINL
jgi:hypothetical protein